MEENIELKIKKRREVIKTVAIILLAVMLVLTLFSNTIMNRSLVEVSTQQIFSDSITSKVRGTGTVESSENYSVIIEETRKIATVKVKTGDTVSEGDVLFTLSEGDSEELKEKKTALEEAENAYTSAVLESGLTASERQAIESGKTPSLDTMQKNLDSAQATIDTAKATVTTVTETYNTAVKTQSAAQTSYENLSAEYEELVAADPGDDDSYTAKITAKKKEVDSAKTTLATANTALTTAEEAKEKAEAAYEEATTAKSDLSAKYTAELSLDASYKNITSLKSEVAELEANALGGEIAAPLAGTVVEVDYVAGQTAQAGETLMLIQPENKSFLLKFDVTATQAKNIKSGDEATVINNWYGDDIKATVLSVKKQSGSDTYLVTVSMTGDVNVGDSYTVSVGEKSANYDYIVPTSCIREDSNGKYILTVTSKSTPLGNRYYATRTAVEVLASDDTYSAISGAIEYYGYVITTTTKPIEPNQQIRLAD